MWDSEGVVVLDQKAFKTAFSKLTKLSLHKDMNKQDFSCRVALNFQFHALCI